MATTVNTDLVIYDDLAQTAFLERRQDNLEVFNASSNGAILLDNELIEGDVYGSRLQSVRYPAKSHRWRKR